MGTSYTVHSALTGRAVGFDLTKPSNCCRLTGERRGEQVRGGDGEDCDGVTERGYGVGLRCARTASVSLHPSSCCACTSKKGRAGTSWRGGGGRRRTREADEEEEEVESGGDRQETRWAGRIVMEDKHASTQTMSMMADDTSSCWSCRAAMPPRTHSAGALHGRVEGDGDSCTCVHSVA